MMCACGKIGVIYSGLNDAVYCSEECAETAPKYDDVYPPTVETKPHTIAWKATIGGSNAEADVSV